MIPVKIVGTIVLVLFIHGHGLSLAVPCPEPEVVASCNCTTGDDGQAFGIQCLHIESLEKFKQVMNSVTFPDPLPSLYVIFGDMGDLSEPGIFGGNRFEYIGIEDSNVTAISADTFAGMEDVLLDLGLSSNLMIDFPYEIIPSFTKLERLSIGSNPIKEIRPIVSSTMKTFYMDETEISDIPANVFVGAPNIETLFGYWSKTKVLRSGFGESIPSMYNLFMGSNEIVEIEPEALHFNSPQLYFIDLGINNITTIPPGGIAGEKCAIKHT